jgi:hypothetical protein
MTVTLMGLVLLLAGCDDDGGSETIPGACDLGGTGQGGDLAVSARGAPIELERLETQAMNTMQLDSESSLGPHRLGGLRWGACESGGAAFVQRGGGSPQLAYLDASAATVEVVAPWSSGSGPSLFFEPDCTPVVIAASSGVYREFRRDGAAWIETIIFDPAVDLPTEGLGQPSPVAADLGRDGRWHLFAHAGMGDDLRLVHGSRGAAAGSGWEFEALPGPEATDIYDYAVDGSGAVHVVYSSTPRPCDPCDVTLYHAELGASGAWARDVVQQGVWGPPYDEFCTDAALTIDSDDRPVVAAQFQRRVETGSLVSAALRVYVRRGAEFCGEVVASESDGYAGSDGSDFTGSIPAVEVDGSGRIHVLFADLSAWHDSHGSNTISGQVRYAVRAGNGWQTFPLVEQPGQTQSPDPLVGVGRLGLALTASGDNAIFAASEWEWSTGSIYNSSEFPLEVRGVVRRIDISAR